MNIVIPLCDLNEKNIFLLEKIKNNIIIDGFFIKTIYSMSYFSLNIILIEIPFLKLKKIINVNKIIYIIDTKINEKIIEKLKQIEVNILEKITPNISLKKTPCYKLFETFKNGEIKIFKNTDYEYTKCYGEYKYITNLILKISGIWISKNNYGLSYKFNHI
jgi:hypothetical protein